VATYTAVFHIQDHRNVIVNTIGLEQDLSDNAPENYYCDGIVETLLDIRSDLEGAQFSGLFLSQGARFMNLEAVLESLSRFDLDADKSFVRRYPLLAKPPAGETQRKPLATVRRQVEKKSLYLWYDNEKDLPRRARRRFSAYTFVYFDLEEIEVRQAEIYLHGEFDAALSQLIIDEPYGRWEPIGIFPGSVSAEITPDIFYRSAGYARYARQHQAAEALFPGDLGTAAAVPEIMAEVLVKEAVARLGLDGFIGPESHGALTAGQRASQWDMFLGRVKEVRPLMVIETQYWELAEAIGAFLADALELPYTSAARVFGTYELDEMSAADRVILFDDRVFGRGRELSQDWVRQAIKNLTTSRHIGVCVVGNRFGLPHLFQDHVDLEMELPGLVRPVRDRIFGLVFGPEAVGDNEDEAWARYVVPLDVQKIAVTGLRGRRALKDLRARVERRLANTNASRAPGLSEIEGIGEAKLQAMEIVEDIKLAAAGDLPWSEVDKGMLLVGPPGTGKTMLAQAISKESGLRFLHGSTSEWFSTRYISTHIAAIRNFFLDARRLAPTIAFIDEFDSIGNRQHDHGVNNIYVNDIVNTMLEELQGFEQRDGIIVIGATNNPDAIDPALMRSGRLDQTIHIPLPNALGLEQIYSYYVEKLRHQGLIGGQIDCRLLSRMTLGQTGADVEFYVRGARRRARKERRKIVQDDFISEIMGRPIGDSGFVRMDETEIERTSVHEAGHAVMQLTGPQRGEQISYISIIPRSDGSLGFVASYNEQVSLTKEEVFELVRVALGGRAAEDLVYGSEHVSTGAGGGPRSDLAQATRILMRALYQHGYSEKAGLVWYDVEKIEQGRLPIPPELREELNMLLDRLYSDAFKRIRDNRGMLDKISRILIEKQEMTGDDLRATIGGGGFFARN